MAGMADGLADLFPKLSMPEDTSLPLSAQAEALLARLQEKRERLNRWGIYFGRARQAVNQNCKKCGMCLYGCPYGVIFNATQTLEKLLDHTAFSYQKGHYVNRFEERDGGVRLWAHDLVKRQQARFSAGRIFIACGVLPTTQLVMSSLGYFDQPIYMKDSQHFYLPLLHAWQTKHDPGTEETNSLVQLFVEIMGSGGQDKTAHVQLYTFNDLYAVDMSRRFGPCAKMFAPLIDRLSRRLIVAQGFLHSDYSSEVEIRLHKDGKKTNLRMEEKSNTKTKDAIGLIRTKLSKMSRATGLVPLTAFSRQGMTGSSFHCGSTFPMSDEPTGLESDTLGRPAGLRNVFVVDASVLPSIPATTITLSVMANAHRIAMESAKAAD